MKRFRHLLLPLFALGLGGFSVAADLNFSGKNDSFDHPAVATGFDRKTGSLTGVISFLRTAPGQTDECRILFNGDAANKGSLKLRYFDVGIDSVDERYSPISRAVVEHAATGPVIKISKKELFGNCEWILGYVGEPAVKEQGNALLIAIPGRQAGDWSGVYVIKSKRANFYKSPVDNAAGKAFLVSGDTVYVYNETSDRYLVKFQGRSNLTTGWIKKSDTVQF